MNSDNKVFRLLGAAFLFVFAASVAAMILPMSLLSGSMLDNLAKIANHLTRMRISILVELVTSTGIVFLAVLLYTVLRNQNRVVALVALGWWLAEAITLAVSKLGAFALIPLSAQYVQAGAPDASTLETLAALFYGVDRWGYDIHMWFFCLGGMLWYSLLLKSRMIPRALSIWGIAAVSLAWIGTVMGWLALPKPIFLVLPNALFEVAIGLWLLTKGVQASDSQTLS